jgi:spermidine/putrescine-binding protein
MKRRVLVRMAGLCAMLVIAAACSSNNADSGGGGGGGSPGSTTEPSGTLRLFSYGDGFDDDYIKSFREQYPQVDLKTSPFGSNDEAVAKLQAGFQADVVNSCVDESTLEMVQKGLYQPLDLSRIPDWGKIFPAFKTLPGVTVDGKTYMIPVDAGTAGIMYNADAITTPPTSWKDLFDPQYKGQAAMEDISVTAIDIGALILGYSDPLSMTPDQLDNVKNYLIDHKDQFRTFWHSDAEVNNLFKNGEIVIASGYPGNALALQKEGVNVKFVAAQEGQMLWTCGYGISTDAQNIDAAYALINWYLSPEAELYEAKYFAYTVANSRVLDIAPQKLIDEASLDSPYHFDNAIPASPPKDRSAWTEVWTEVKAA